MNMKKQKQPFCDSEAATCANRCSAGFPHQRKLRVHQHWLFQGLPSNNSQTKLQWCAYSFATAAGLSLSRLRLQSEPGEERAILAPPPPTTTTTATTTTTTTRTRTRTTRKTRSRPFRTRVFCHFSSDLPTSTVSFFRAIGICMVSLLIFATNHFHEK